jgi:hypothetical protein
MHSSDAGADNGSNVGANGNNGGAECLVALVILLGLKRCGRKKKKSEIVIGSG